MFVIMIRFCKYTTKTWTRQKSLIFFVKKRDDLGPRLAVVKYIFCTFVRYFDN